MTARRVALLLVALLAVYMAFVAHRGYLLVRDGRPVAVALGIGVLLLPVIGLWFVWTEVRLGRDAERLGRQAEAEGALAVTEEGLLGADGKVLRDRADEVFQLRRAEVEQAPEDWRAWYRLAVAYGDAGDTRRGRQALRRAIALQRR